MDRFDAWAQAQVPYHEGRDRRLDESWNSERPEGSLRAILNSFTNSLIWDRFQVEPILRVAIERLVRTRLVEVEGPVDDAKSPLKLTALGRRMFGSGAYFDYLRSVQAVAEFWLPANAMVSTGEGAGSCFFVDRRVAVTCRHVVEGRPSKSLVVQDESNRSYSVSSVGMHESADVDLALLHTAEEFPGEPMHVGGAARVLDRAVIFGYPPVGLIPPVLLCHRAEVTAVSDLRYGKGPRVLLLSCIVRPGNSGGPVLDEWGNVIGVVSQNLHCLEAESPIESALGYAAAVSSEYLSDPGRFR